MQLLHLDLVFHQQVKGYLVLPELKVEAVEDKVKVQKLHQQEVEDKHIHQ